MRNPKAVGADLHAWMARQGVSEIELARAVSASSDGLTVTQSWVSRIAQGKFRRFTARVQSIAAYADIPIEDQSRRDADGSIVIRRAVSEVWNGSLSHANLIARLIKVAKVLPDAETNIFGERHIGKSERRFGDDLGRPSRARRLIARDKE